MARIPAINRAVRVPLWEITRMSRLLVDRSSPYRLPYEDQPDVWTQTHLIDVNGAKSRQTVSAASVGARYPTKFRLYDDDGNLYFEGIVRDDGSGDQAFAPLWQYGEAFGCTGMKLWEPGKGGGWKWL